jgi:hypothetical protein
MHKDFVIPVPADFRKLSLPFLQSSYNERINSLGALIPFYLTLKAPDLKVNSVYNHEQHLVIQLLQVQVSQEEV